MKELIVGATIYVWDGNYRVRNHDDGSGPDRCDKLAHWRPEE